MYIAIDGDNIGKKLEKYILNENMNKLNEISLYISNRIANIEKLIINFEGQVFMSGGDNILALIPDSSINDFIAHINNINKLNDIKFSVGYSSQIKSTYFALKYAKSIGAGTITCADIKNNSINFRIVTI